MREPRGRRGSTSDGSGPWGPGLRVAVGVGGFGVVLVLIAIVMGTSLRGLSLATGIHLLGVLAVLTGCALAAGTMIRFARVDGRGRPIVGLAIVVVLVSTGWLVVSIRTELAAGRLWDALIARLEADGPAAGPELVRRFEDIPEPELRVKFVKRMGELGDVRTASFLRDVMREHPEPGVRNQAAVSYGKVANPAQIDQMIQSLSARLQAGPIRDRILTALRTATGQDLGNRQEDWLRWRLESLLEEGTPDAIETLIRRMGHIAPSLTDLYKDLRKRLTGCTDPALHLVFERALKGKLAGQRQLDRRAMAAQALGGIGLPESIDPLKGAIRWARGQRLAGKMREEDAERFWRTAARSLRAIAGKSILDDRRFAPVYDYFLSLLDDPDEIVSNFAADQLEALSGQKHGLDVDRWRAWHEDRTVRAHVEAKDVRALIVDLRRQIGAADLERSQRAMRALVRTGDPDGFREIRSVAMNRSAEVRLRTIALDVLAKAKKGLTVEDLTGLLDRAEEVPVLRSAVEALGGFDEDPVVKALHERFLIEETVDLRRTILTTLRRMTVDAVFAALVDAVRDEVPAICEAAAEELHRRSGKRYGVDPEKWEDWFRRSFK